jgi:post-segregation antitoxin (ccd killing protein)
MRNRFDYVGKRIGREALGPFGTTILHDEISPETQYADIRHEPDPACVAKRRRLGLLGRITSVLCLIEIYGHAPSGAELRACLTKHLAFWQQRARKARKARGRKKQAFVEPFLWILSPDIRRTLASKLKLEPAPGWPEGVYFFGADVLRVGLVAASELPRDRSTLLVRLMTAGPQLARTVAELYALPKDVPERMVAEPPLLQLQHVLANKPSLTPQEEEFVVTMYSTWEDARQLGEKQGRARDVLTVLRARGIKVSQVARKRILAEQDAERLERWLQRASVATSLAAVLDDPGSSPARRVTSPRARRRAQGGSRGRA